MSDDPLLQPYRLKHLTLKNRIMITAHEPAYAEDGMPKERYRLYHVERAKAGIGLTMTAGSAAVSRDSPPVFNNILAYRDDVVPWMRELTDSCHEFGTAVMIQLTHLGRRTRWDKGDWLPALSASHHREASHRAFPKRMEDWDFDRIIMDFADAAERMRAAGVDGIELEAYGHLIDQTWSPLTNDLPAPFGGSLENRLQFTWRLLKAIRQRVGNEFIVGMRYTGDEMLPGGLTKEDGLQISQLLKDSGWVDFLNVIRGHIDTDAGLTDVIPIQGMPRAPHLDFAGEIRARIQMPTFHAGALQDVATARFAIRESKVDVVGLTRPHMADPHIVQKIVRGQEATIRPCVGANYCLDRIYQGGSAYCIHNAATGRELTMPHILTRSERRQKVVIVGAGPGGLEAARVASERGHDVVVFEAASEPGGQVRLTSLSARRKEMMGIVDWRMDRCAEGGVRFRFDTYAEAQEVLAENPDVVVVATGGQPGRAELAYGTEIAVSSWDIIAGSTKSSGSVLLFDDAGDHAALQAAEVAAEAGATVEIMTPDRTFAPEVMAMNLVPYMRSLQRRNVTFTVTYRLKGIRQQGEAIWADVTSDYGDIAQTRKVQQVIVNHGTLPNEELYFALKPLSRNLGAVGYKALVQGRNLPLTTNPDGRFQLFRIGDAVASRNTHAAIYDALRLLKDL